MDKEYGLQFRHEDDDQGWQWVIEDDDRGWQWVIEQGRNYCSKSRSVVENEKTFRESLTKNLVYRIVERDVSDWRVA